MNNQERVELIQKGKMEAKDKHCIQKQILEKYPSTDFEIDIDWDIVEIAFKVGESQGIREVVEPSDELLEIGRKAIEDVLVEWRNNRLSEFNRGNGLVIREMDGRDSSIIRFGPEVALKIGMKAIGQAKLKEWGIE